MPSRLHRWYHEPSGVGEVLRVMLPLVISTMSWQILQFTDRLFLLWHSPKAMAAAMPAGMAAFAVLCFPLGLVSYVNTFVAQYFGAGQPRRIGVAVWQAIFLALAFTPLALATNLLAPRFFAASGHEADVAAMENVYFQIMNFGAGGMLVSAALSSFFTGRGQTRVVMIVDSSAALFNIGLDYLWIFGIWGFPEAGIAGAAWATVVSLWLKTAVYVWLFLRAESRREFGTGRCRWDGALAWRLVSFGIPSGLQFFIEVAGFTAFLFLVGGLGSLELAATNLAFNINGLAFMPVWGAGIAASVLVGQRLGENRPDLAARATWNCFTLASVYMLAFSAIYVLLPEQLLWLHKMDAPEGAAVDFAALERTTIVLLRFVALYCIFDAMFTVFCGAIKGAGDTRFILVTSSLLAAAGVAITYVGLRRFDFGLIACWVVITGWIVALGVTYWLRFLGGQWRTMRVIEPEAERPAAQVEPAIV